MSARKNSEKRDRRCLSELLHGKTIKLVVKRSIFIPTSFPVHSECEIQDTIDSVRKDHPKANHVVWAYVLGTENSQMCGLSDDGEPKGTAGRPVLRVLQYNGFTNILVAIVRYFGGTKLGMGGLVRAYTDSVKAVVEQVPCRAVKEETTFIIVCDYRFYEPVKHRLLAEGARIIAESFDITVSLKCTAEKKRYPTIVEDVNRLTNGSAGFTYGPSDGW